jgi:hypothetical protein
MNFPKRERERDIKSPWLGVHDFFKLPKPITLWIGKLQIKLTEGFGPLQWWPSRLSELLTFIAC